jgi:RHS repeat-associated protein
MRDKKSRGAGTNTPTTQAYTGQKRESSFGLYDYNARWYDSALGRFTQADTIVPNPASAKAFDRYAYVENNPIRYNDPSGHCKSDDLACWDVADSLYKNYGWTIDQVWSLDEITKLQEASRQIEGYFYRNGGGDAAGRMRAAFGSVLFHKGSTGLISSVLYLRTGNHHVIDNIVHLNPSDMRTDVMIHELGHILDNHQASSKWHPGGGTVWGTGTSIELARYLDFDPERCGINRLICPEYTRYTNDHAKDGDPMKAPNSYAQTSFVEDFAESFLFSVQNNFPIGSKRKEFFSQLVSSYTATSPTYNGNPYVGKTTLPYRQPQPIPAPTPKLLR